MNRLLILGCGLLLCWGCASYTVLPTEDRAAIEQEFLGKSSEQFLKLSYYVTPFFGDASKKLLTALPPDEVRLLEKPNGDPISPGPIEKIIPAGTRVKIQRVEFPSAWTVSERVLFSPRTQPWVYVEIENEAKKQPFILVLRPQIKSREEFWAEIGRYLTDRDLTPRLAGWSESVREAIRTKSIVEDMPVEALEMAWGYPEQKKMSFQGPIQKEQWVYPGARRTANISDGRLNKADATRP